ncbi:Arm DNA-binding domain-containing protein [Burkholderia stagnalis]
MLDGSRDGPKTDANRQTSQSAQTSRQTRLRRKGAGLPPTPTKSGCKWTLRFTGPVTGKRRDAGLGTCPEIPIAEARENAPTMRKFIDRGEGPSRPA